jgi:hypothetical protein
MNKKNILFCVLFIECTHVISLQADFAVWFKHFATAPGAQFALDLVKSAPQLPVLKNIFDLDDQAAFNLKQGEQQIVINCLQLVQYFDQILKGNKDYEALSALDRLMACQVGFIIAAKTRTTIGMVP